VVTLQGLGQSSWVELSAPVDESGNNRVQVVSVVQCERAGQAENDSSDDAMTESRTRGFRSNSRWPRDLNRVPS
jgi:hypothetical protein